MVETEVGDAQPNDGESGGVDVAVIVISKKLLIPPSVKVNFAVPDELNVTANGVLIAEDEIFAPVNVHSTDVVGVMFVLF